AIATRRPTTRAAVTSTSWVASAWAPSHRPHSCRIVYDARRMAVRRLTLLAVLAALGCHAMRAPMHPETPAGSWYVVAKGETVDDVARRAGVPAEDILEINGLSRAEEVRPGKLIFLLAPEGAKPEPVQMPAATIASGPGFAWPLANVARSVGSPFGTRGGRAHEGIDLPAPTGTPVLAVADGVVVYAGAGIRGYGNLVVLQ